MGYTLQISVAATYYLKAFYLAVFNIYYHFTGTYSLGCVFKCHFVAFLIFYSCAAFLTAAATASATDLSSGLGIMYSLDNLSGVTISAIA